MGMWNSIEYAWQEIYHRYMMSTLPRVNNLPLFTFDITYTNKIKIYTVWLHIFVFENVFIVLAILQKTFNKSIGVWYYEAVTNRRVCIYVYMS